MWELFLFFSFLNLGTGFCQMMVKIIVHTVYLGDPDVCVRWESTLLPLDFRPNFIYPDAFWHTGWLVGWLVALKLTADVCSSPPPLDCLHSSPLCAACARHSKLSVLHTPAKMTCSVEFCWPPFDSEICFMSLNFCTCNYFVHKTSEWFSFCLFLKKPKRLLKFDSTLLFFYVH